MYLIIELFDNDFRTSGLHALRFVWSTLQDLDLDHPDQGRTPEAIVTKMLELDKLKPFIIRMIAMYSEIIKFEVATRFIKPDTGSSSNFNSFFTCKNSESVSSTLSSTEKYLKNLHLSIRKEVDRDIDHNGEFWVLNLDTGNVWSQ